MALETFAVVLEVGLVATNSVMEATSVVEVALMSAEAVVDLMGVRMATTDLVMVETVLEVVQATMSVAVKTINLQILDPQREETLEADTLAPVEVQPNISSNRAIKVAVVVPAAAVARAVVRGFNYY